MENGTDVRRLWAATKLHVWPERYRLVSLPLEHAAAAAEIVVGSGGFAALVRERDEVSLTVREETWFASPLRAAARAEEGPFRAITLDLDLSLAICGFLAPAAVRLAAAHVSIVPQCGFLKDHLLVHEAYLEASVEVLEGLIAASRE
jgi:hypothetical protein